MCQRGLQMSRALNTHSPLMSVNELSILFRAQTTSLLLVSVTTRPHTRIPISSTAMCELI